MNLRSLVIVSLALVGSGTAVPGHEAEAEYQYTPKPLPGLKFVHRWLCDGRCTSAKGVTAFLSEVAATAQREPASIIANPAKKLHDKAVQLTWALLDEIPIVANEVCTDGRCAGLVDEAVRVAAVVRAHADLSIPEIDGEQGVDFTFGDGRHSGKVSCYESEIDKDASCSVLLNKDDAFGGLNYTSRADSQYLHLWKTDTITGGVKLGGDDPKHVRVFGAAMR
jgi:hypothetical protein